MTSKIRRGVGALFFRRSTLTALSCLFAIWGCEYSRSSDRRPSDDVSRGGPGVSAGSDSESQDPVVVAPPADGAVPPAPLPVDPNIDPKWRSLGQARALQLGTPVIENLNGNAIAFYQGVPFCRMGDSELYLNLARPAVMPTNPVPGVVMAAGGGFVSGNRRAFNNHTKRLAARGWVGATVDYRRSGGPGEFNNDRLSVRAPFPAAILDVSCAVRWMKTYAAQLGLNPNRIGLHGGSAGGQIGVMLGLRAAKVDLDPQRPFAGVSSSVVAISNVNGPNDFVSLIPVTSRDEFPATARYLGVTPADLENPNRAEIEAILREASSVAHLKATSPPIISQHGTADERVHIVASRSLERSAKMVGASHELVEFLGEGHSFSDAANIRIQQNAFEFLSEHLE